MIRAYIGEKPLHTHENAGLEDFLEQLDSRWGVSDEVVTVVAHALWNGAEIDAVCILPRALVVLDFKNYGGHIRVSENGPWRGDGGPVKGGSKLNPLVQIRDNKRALMSWLQDRNFLPNSNLGHVSGAVVFLQPVTVDGDLGPKIRSWFHVTDLDRCSGVLASLASPEIQIDQECTQKIIHSLGVSEYRRLREPVHVERLVGAGAPEAREGPLTERQQEAVATIAQFLATPDLRSLSILGMTHTGKTRLLREAIPEVARLGRQPIVLAPNSRIARRLSMERGLDCRSIYSHLYDRSREVGLSLPEQSGGQKRAVRSFPARACADPEDCVYLIDDAHLLSNDYFEVESGKCFGSGQLFNDFVEFSALGSSSRKLLLFGDPFQLPRGRREAMPLFAQVQRAASLPSSEFTLTEVFESPSASAALASARRLAGAIAALRFTTLRLETGPGLTILAASDAPERIGASFQSRPKDSCVISSTHAKVAGFNRAIRGQLLTGTSEQNIAPGDLLEFFFGADETTEPFSSSSSALQTGDRLIIQSADGGSSRRSQTLTGREAPIEFTTLSVTALARSAPRTLMLLEEFLLSERPELASELAVALEVWQKRHEQDVISLVRYGYSCTGHHAQTFGLPICFVDASSDDGRHSEGYFRWLYTALTRASEHCFLLNFRALDPLDEAQWKETGATKTSSIPLGGGWNFGVEASRPGPTPSISEEADKGRSGPAPRLAILGGKVREVASRLGWQVMAVKSVPYQEQFHLSRADRAELRLLVSYSQHGEVTALRLAEPEADRSLLFDIAEAMASESLADIDAQEILLAVSERAKRVALRVAAARRDGEYRLTVVLASTTDERAQIEINHKKGGLVTAVRLVKFTGLQVVDLARALIVTHGLDV